MNPSPAFTFSEDRSGQPIGNTIVRLLAAEPHGQNAPKTGEPNVTQEKTQNDDVATARRHQQGWADQIDGT